MYNFINNLARKVKYPKSSTFINKIINQMYYEQGVSCIRNKDVDYIVVGGNKFYPHEQLWCVTQPEGPWFEGIRETDIALDLGADIGGVTIPLARKCKKVYSVEPVYYEALNNNVKLNSLTNVEVIPYALGKDIGFTSIEYGSGKRSDVPCFPLIEFINKDKIDFLKVDIEGAEWGIPCYPEIRGIRELRIEFHRRRGHKEDKEHVLEWIDWLECNGYKVEVDINVHKEISILFSGVDYMRASKIE
jgi:FkbM family methyltransferase